MPPPAGPEGDVKSSVLTLNFQLEALATDFLLWPKRGASGTLVEVNNASAGQEREPAIVLDHPALNHDDRRSIVTREPGDANHALGQTVDRTVLRIRWHGTLYFYEEVAYKTLTGVDCPVYCSP